MLNIEKLKEVVVDFFKTIQLEYSSLQITEKDNKVFIQVIPIENQASLYIGFRGGNLNAIQHILKSLLWDGILPKEMFLSLDIDFYREKNEKKILEILDEKIKLAQSTGFAQVMPFLTAGDRRMVHMTVLEKYSDIVETESFDDEEGKRTLKIINKTPEDSSL